MTELSNRAVQTNRDLTIGSGNPATSITQPFDPESGTTVISPQGEGSGWWVGAPSVFWDGSEYFLSFRTRRPQPERGGLFQIARSSDGESFDVIASIRKEDLGTSSIERGALLRTDEGRWRLYLSYVDPVDDRWRIDLIEADSPAELTAEKRISILGAADIGTEGVKDPWICRADGLWFMIVSYAPTPIGGISHDQMHGTRDIYNTGTSKSLTGLATSSDGLTWDWHGSVFEPSEDGWDEYAARINTVYADGNQFIGLYDGSKSVDENYEERCGAATSTDLRNWTRASTDGPIVGPNGGPGSVRYAEAVQAAGWTRFYYEYTRPDGSHELRTVLVDRE
ncbi:MAG: hypothetical protein WKF81_14630 [Thermomicrobiales bacterium]